MTISSKHPRTERGRKTLRSILDAAMIDFEENGFTNASIVHITTKANVAIGSFYTYFNSKEEIYLNIIQNISKYIQQYIEEYINCADRSQGKLSLCTAAVAMAHFSNKGMFKIIDESEFVSPDNYRDFYCNMADYLTSNLDSMEFYDNSSGNIDKTASWLIIGMGIFLGKKHIFNNEDLDKENFKNFIYNVIK
jgi:AcrR family transcriptional regulator